ncbi:hypothetical protein, partial [Candidatus Villigracilis vicinus]|uniref:hypothetical protein n=1 Tax=Candidatus Villigracilis vicinus TaxID=3140679 RepID=UPI0031EADF11
SHLSGALAISAKFWLSRDTNCAASTAELKLERGSSAGPYSRSWLYWVVPSCDFTQAHGTTMKYAYQQPHEVLNLCLPLFPTQFTNSANPSTIGLVDRHEKLLWQGGLSQSNFTRFFVPINVLFVKLSGR